MKSKRALTAAFLIFGLITITTPRAEASNNRDREIVVMTMNMHPGTDFGEIFAAQTLPELMSEVAEAFGDVQTSNVQERINAMADRIAESRPALVGLQEAALWRTGAIGDPAPASTVAFDYLQMLLDALSTRGQNYSAVAVQSNFDAELPGMSATFASDVRFTDRVATLARADMQVSQLKIEGAQTAVFNTVLTVSTASLGNITIPRGWTSVDLKLRGKQYRFINAHLESFHPLVQYLQGGELLSGPAAIDKAVILSGDFNSDAESGGATYNLLISGGFADVWEVIRTNDPGATWPLFIESPAIFTTPIERLDLVLIRGRISAASIDVVGEDPISDTTPSNLRMSDHGAVTAGLVLEP